MAYVYTACAVHVTYTVFSAGSIDSVTLLYLLAVISNCMVCNFTALTQAATHSYALLGLL